MGSGTDQEREPQHTDVEQAGEAAPADDEARLAALEALHVELETELERDVDEAGPSGR